MNKKDTKKAVLAVLYAFSFSATSYAAWELSPSLSAPVSASSGRHLLSRQKKG